MTDNEKLWLCIGFLQGLMVTASAAELTLIRSFIAMLDVAPQPTSKDSARKREL